MVVITTAWSSSTDMRPLLLSPIHVNVSLALNIHWILLFQASWGTGRLFTGCKWGESWSNCIFNYLQIRQWFKNTYLHFMKPDYCNIRYETRLDFHENCSKSTRTKSVLISVWTARETIADDYVAPLHKIVLFYAASRSSLIWQEIDPRCQLRMAWQYFLLIEDYLNGKSESAFAPVSNG